MVTRHAPNDLPLQSYILYSRLYSVLVPRIRNIDFTKQNSNICLEMKMPSQICRGGLIAFIFIHIFPEDSEIALVLPRRNFQIFLNIRKYLNTYSFLSGTNEW